MQRFRVSLPITFYWGTNNVFSKGNGTSRDISTRGVFILTSETVVAGSDLWLKFSVPQVRKGARVSEMKGFGRIVRVQNDGFAVNAAVGFTNQGTRKKSKTALFSGPLDEPKCADKLVDLGRTALKD